jgi:hypothetical protein
MSQKFDEMVCVCRGQAFVAKACVERLDLLPPNLIQLLPPERLLQTQFVSLQVLLPCALVHLTAFDKGAELLQALESLCL